MILSRDIIQRVRDIPRYYLAIPYGGRIAHIWERDDPICGRDLVSRDRLVTANEYKVCSDCVERLN